MTGVRWETNRGPSRFHARTAVPLVISTKGSICRRRNPYKRQASHVLSPVSARAQCGDEAAIVEYVVLEARSSSCYLRCRVGIAASDRGKPEAARKSRGGEVLQPRIRAVHAF